ncbi:DsbA family protein [Acinetobacter baumannii]
MRVDVWSDVVCPFCYIGKNALNMSLPRQVSSLIFTGIVSN